VASVQCACFVTRMGDSINMCKHGRGASQVPARALPLFIIPPCHPSRPARTQLPQLNYASGFLNSTSASLLEDPRSNPGSAVDLADDTSCSMRDLGTLSVCPPVAGGHHDSCGRRVLRKQVALGHPGARWWVQQRVCRRRVAARGCR
jgi:hypothetical protein